jgi:hypothetical protein
MCDLTFTESNIYTKYVVSIDLPTERYVVAVAAVGD